MKHQVEEVYKKVSQLEHVLLRPDTYVGSIEATEQELWVMEGGNFHLATIEYHPGLYKIFDEILVNAADNYQRDKSMSKLDVKISESTISIENDGKGIPIQIHKELQLYIPEMIFGHLLTSSNYNDSIKKVTGGRNGFGAKLTNIFSNEFTVETCDGHKQFKMTWSKNMTVSSKPEIKDQKGKQFTRITYKPDFARFKIRQFSDQMICLFGRRVYDMAAIMPSVKVSLNGQSLKVDSFSDYVKLHNLSKIVQTSQKRWDVAVGVSDGQLSQVSFVNAINTVRGGTHVNHVVDQISDGLIDHIKKKHKDFKAIKPHQIKQHLFVFVNCLIENPSFDSQTKETLTTKANAFGSTFVLEDKFLDQIIKKTDVVNNIILAAKSKMDNKMAKQLSGKKTSRLLGIDKLEDANDAGTKNAEHCTLIITEGDSAKSLAMAGIEVVGRDRWGVFPLRGKMLNVRDANTKQIMENKEIEALVKILGLKFNQNYDNLKSLRYGALMIMTDQDHDGHHIKGLIINLFDKFWPSLLKTKGFLKQFITPIIKATKKESVQQFFSIIDYKKWCEQASDSHLYKIKYYKGLGTSTDQEGQQYFSKLSQHVKPFKYVNQEDSDYIDLVFNKTKADQRKDWLLKYSWDSIGDTLDYTQQAVRYKDFITECLALYSVSDNIRSIPSMLDGLKPTQRKILYSLLGHPKNEYKVSSLTGLVSQTANYHHGETSLFSTAITMAQNFTGANNINLLLPQGQFGSRALGGKDAASARYLFTKLNPLSTKLFIEDDMHTYQYTVDEGLVGEPTSFMPIIPLILVNGAEGIGTGWSSYVPQYNPREIVKAIKDRMQAHPFQELTPWYRGFAGTITPHQQGFIMKGSFIRNGDTVYITEIPANKNTKDIQAIIQAKMQLDVPEVLDLKEYHAGNKVLFEVQLKEGIYSDDDIEKQFKLSTTIQISNIVLFDERGILKKFTGVAELMEDFYQLRLKQYQLRKDYLISKTKHELDIASNKVQFINWILNGKLNLFNKKKSEMVEILKKNFKSLAQMTPIKSTKKSASEDNNNFDYLLNLPFWTFSEESITKLHNEEKQLKAQLIEIESYSCEEMWTKDLDEFITELTQLEQHEEQEQLKRLEKNIAKLSKSQKAMKDFCDSDSDEQPKRGGVNKVMAQVLREYKNICISSKREAPEPVVFAVKKGRKAKGEKANSEVMQIEISEESSVKPTNQKSITEFFKKTTPKKVKESKRIVEIQEEVDLEEDEKEEDKDEYEPTQLPQTSKRRQKKQVIEDVEPTQEPPKQKRIKKDNVKNNDPDENKNQENGKSKEQPQPQSSNSLYDKYGLTQFLKYFDDKPKTSTNNTTQKPTSELTLAERLMQRQKENSVEIEKAYNEAKQQLNDSDKKRTKQTEHIDIDIDINLDF